MDKKIISEIMSELGSRKTEKKSKAARKNGSKPYKKTNLNKRRYSMKKEINFAVIQCGYNVFGAGETRDKAIEEAAQFVESDDHVQGITINEMKLLLKNRPNDRDFKLISSDNDEFDSYMENCGVYEKINDQWYEK